MIPLRTIHSESSKAWGCGRYSAACVPDLQDSRQRRLGPVDEIVARRILVNPFETTAKLTSRTSGLAWTHASAPPSWLPCYLPGCEYQIPLPELEEQAVFDPPWKDHCGRLACVRAAPCFPMFFMGANSALSTCFARYPGVSDSSRLCTNSKTERPQTSA